MELFDVVAAYDALGDHRTGDHTETATIQWLCQYIERSGARIDIHEYPYIHYQANTHIRLDNREIFSMPLYYESIDTLHQSNNFEFASINFAEDEANVYANILQISDRAKRFFRDAVVIATCCENNSLQAQNVTPVLKHNLPVILVPGRENGMFDDHHVVLDFEASVNEQTGRNIIAHFGNQALENSLVITTPISGWFHCVGERGTGIALAIKLATALGRSQSVALILTTGHELGYLGGFEYTNTLESGPEAVIHIGSCVGTHNAELGAYSNLDMELHNQVDRILSSIDTQAIPAANPLQRTNWVGESECWARFGCPMLSISGNDPRFHTAEDRLPAATSQKLLDNTYATLIELGKTMSGILSSR